MLTIYSSLEAAHPYPMAEAFSSPKIRNERSWPHQEVPRHLL
jgi:hypothetical protein